MELKARLSKGLARLVYRVARLLYPGSYASDGLISAHTHAFLDDPLFQGAYERGVRAIGGQDDYGWQWRVHIGLWAAQTARHLPGDFVECGVNRGFMSSAIMEALDWDRTGKTFYLLDTFAGLDTRAVTPEQARDGALEKNAERLERGYYVSGVESVRANFAQWRNVRIVVGTIPETLAEVTAGAVAYLHIDMNCAPPEVAALRYFWPLLSAGAVVLLDDYAYRGYEAQRLAMDGFAREHGIAICALPTGQGLLVKPPQ
jgi:hypothetical protein